jgi:hypothetical protein
MIFQMRETKTIVAKNRENEIKNYKTPPRRGRGSMVRRGQRELETHNKGSLGVGQSDWIADAFHREPGRKTENSRPISGEANRAETGPPNRAHCDAQQKTGFDFLFNKQVHSSYLGPKVFKLMRPAASAGSAEGS